jgi:hypothetical protein
MRYEHDNGGLVSIAAASGAIGRDAIVCRCDGAGAGLLLGTCGLLFSFLTFVAVQRLIRRLDRRAAAVAELKPLELRSLEPYCGHQLGRRVRALDAGPEAEPPAAPARPTLGIVYCAMCESDACEHCRRVRQACATAPVTGAPGSPVEPIGDKDEHDEHDERVQLGTAICSLCESDACVHCRELRSEHDEPIGTRPLRPNPKPGSASPRVDSAEMAQGLLDESDLKLAQLRSINQSLRSLQGLPATE